jgi:hypothetical protein
MVAILSCFAMALLSTLLLIMLPAEFRKSFFNPATLGERLLVRSLGLVAIVALIAEFTVGQRLDNGLNGISPCVCFGMYCSLVLYARAVYFLRNRQPQKTEATV